jgi:hypothetical protein
MMSNFSRLNWETLLHGAKSNHCACQCIGSRIMVVERYLGLTTWHRGASGHTGTRCILIGELPAGHAVVIGDPGDANFSPFFCEH